MHLQNSETGLLMNKVSLLYWEMHLKPYMTWHFKTNHGIFIWSLYHNIEHTSNQNTGKLFYTRYTCLCTYYTQPSHCMLCWFVANCIFYAIVQNSYAAFACGIPRNLYFLGIWYTLSFCAYQEHKSDSQDITWYATQKHYITRLDSILLTSDAILNFITLIYMTSKYFPQDSLQTMYHATYF